MDNRTFAPSYGEGITVAPTTTSAFSSIDKNKNRDVLCVTNTHASEICYVKTGLASDGTVTATIADYIVLPSQQVTITKAKEHDTVAYLAATASGGLHIIPGQGF